jgi:hypothetical protein
VSYESESGKLTERTAGLQDGDASEAVQRHAVLQAFPQNLVVDKAPDVLHRRPEITLIRRYNFLVCRRNTTLYSGQSIVRAPSYAQQNLAFFCPPHPNGFGFPASAA